MNSHPVQVLLSSLLEPVSGQIPPKGVTMVHYGPDGTSVATQGEADYVAQAGGGLAVRYNARRAGGAPYAESRLAVDGQGRVQQSTTRLLALDGSLRQVVSGSYDGLQLTAAGTPADGVAKLSVTDAQGRLTHSAQMVYSNELYASYLLTSHDTEGQVLANTDISFAQAQMAGTRLVGGVLSVNRSDAKGQRASSAQSFLSVQGVPYRVLLTRYAADGAVDGYVNSDYSGVVFDAMRSISSGQMVVRTTNAQGHPESASVLHFKAGRLISTSVLEGPEQEVAQSTALPVSAAGPWIPSRPADRCNVRRRIDGSLLQKREDWFTQPGSSGTPRRSQVTLYARDGTRAIRLTDVDYAGTHFDNAGNPTGGTIVSTQYQAGVRSSTTCVAY